jgi:hypothetical protein
MELHTIRIDLGKTVFHLVGLNLRGEVVVRKKFSRKQVIQSVFYFFFNSEWMVLIKSAHH